MQAMLIEDDPATRAGSAAALARAGFAVTVAGSVEAAKAAVRHGIVDVLVMAERVGGRLAHDVALLAELRNPGLGTILLSDRTADEAEEIFALLPSLHAVLGRDTPPRMLSQLALATARWQGHEAPALRPEADAAPPQAGAPAEVPVEAPPPAAPSAGEPAPVPAQSLARDPVPVAPPPATPAAVPVARGRAMPPPVPAPNRVPSFLRVSGLRLGPQKEAAPPLAARPVLPPKVTAAPARRLHLA